MVAAVILAGTAAALPPNDPLYAEQWYLTDTKWHLAHDLAPSARQIVVAVLDSGLDLENPEFHGRVHPEPWDFRDGDGDVSHAPLHQGDSETPHGTQVAGVLGAVKDNLEGIVGVADVTILPLRVEFRDANDADTKSAAIRYAADKGADVISMSWGVEPEDEQLISDALGYARSVNPNIVFVAAAGNAFGETPCNQYWTKYPGRDERVIAVAGTNPDGLISVNSLWGPEVDVAAPMEGILTTYPPSLAWDPTTGEYVEVPRGYRTVVGTSFATPQVAGVIALMLAKAPDMTPDTIRGVLRGAADPIPLDSAHGKCLAAGADQPFMHFGKLDALDAVNGAG